MLGNSNSKLNVISGNADAGYIYRYRCCSRGVATIRNLSSGASLVYGYSLGVS